MTCFTLPWCVQIIIDSKNKTKWTLVHEHEWLTLLSVCFEYRTLGQIISNTNRKILSWKKYILLYECRQNQ